MTTKIFVADDVSESGLGPLRAAGFTVEKRPGLVPPELYEALKDCEGLIVRSETKVTADVLDNASSLRVIGRAGVGVDNIDVTAATIRGMVVMNAPDGNTITTAEHTIAMLISLARSIPQATSSLKAGRWDRKKFIGVELQGKTLGIVGLGRIGRVVASRARAMGMLIVAYDPFIAPEQARDLEIAPRAIILRSGAGEIDPEPELRGPLSDVHRTMPMPLRQGSGCPRLWENASEEVGGAQCFRR